MDRAPSNGQPEGKRASQLDIRTRWERGGPRTAAWDLLWRTLLDEAENERMHLMTFIQIAKPGRLERTLIVLTQGAFYNAFFALYLISPRTAHRIVGYFEEEAVISYTEYLEEIDAGKHENVPAPQIAIDYWKLAPDARLRDVVLVIRNDEAGHRDVNHGFADELKGAEREDSKVHAK